VFSHERAGDNATAVAALDGVDGGAFLGGGTNLVDLMKLRVARPELLIDVARLPNDRIELLADGGVRIGGAVRNSDQAADRTIRTRYPVLARALLSGASPQLRNRNDRPKTCCSAPAASTLQDVTKPCNKRKPVAAAQRKPAYHATGVRVRRLPLRSDDFLR